MHDTTVVLHDTIASFEYMTMILAGCAAASALPPSLTRPVAITHYERPGAHKPGFSLASAGPGSLLRTVFYLSCARLGRGVTP